MSQFLGDLSAWIDAHTFLTWAGIAVLVIIGLIVNALLDSWNTAKRADGEMRVKRTLRNWKR